MEEVCGRGVEFSSQVFLSAEAPGEEFFDIFRLVRQDKVNHVSAKPRSK